jgi:hypothetical protein
LDGSIQTERDDEGDECEEECLEILIQKLLPSGSGVESGRVGGARHERIVLKK